MPPRSVGVSRLRRDVLPVRLPVFYGWVVVAVAGLGMFFAAPGQSYFTANFIDAYLRTFHISRTLISELFSMATLLSGLVLFLVGRVVDRLCQRAVAVAAAILLAATCVFQSAVSDVFELFVAFVALRLLGQGTMTLIPNSVVPQWFVRQRGRAVSIMAVGTLVGAAVIPSVNNWLIALLGWQDTWRIWAGLLIVIFLPAALLIRNRPEDVGLRPDGDGAVASGRGGARRGEDVPSWTLHDAMRTRAFWFVIVGAMTPAIVNTGIVFQFYSILGLRGIGPGAAAFLLSVYAVTGFLATFAGGILVERVQVNKVMCAAFTLALVQYAVLLQVRTEGMAALFAVLWGVSRGILNVSFRVIWPNYFGRRHLGSIVGAMATATVVGSAIGPVSFGWAYDRFGGYNQVIAVMMLLPAVSAVLALLATRPLPTPYPARGASG